MTKRSKIVTERPRVSKRVGRRPPRLKPTRLGAELLRRIARVHEAIAQGTDTPAGQKRLDRACGRAFEIEQRIVARPTRSSAHAVDRAIVWLVNDDGDDDASDLAARGMAWHLLRLAGIPESACSTC